jgi:hypothetical protein
MSMILPILAVLVLGAPLLNLTCNAVRVLLWITRRDAVTDSE